MAVESASPVQPGQHVCSAPDGHPVAPQQQHEMQQVEPQRALLRHLQRLPVVDILSLHDIPDGPSRSRCAAPVPGRCPPRPFRRAAPDGRPVRGGCRMPAAGWCAPGVPGGAGPPGAAPHASTSLARNLPSTAWPQPTHLPARFFILIFLYFTTSTSVTTSSDIPVTSIHLPPQLSHAGSLARTRWVAGRSSVVPGCPSGGGRAGRPSSFCPRRPGLFLSRA